MGPLGRVSVLTLIVCYPDQDQPANHVTSATGPQQRKLNQTIITNMIDTARNPVATFRPTGTDVDRALIDDRNSTRRGLFIGFCSCRPG